MNRLLPYFLFVVVLCALAGACRQIETVKSENYVFPSEAAELRVTFLQTPDISEQQVFGRKAVIAQINTGDTFLRAESMEFTSEEAENLTGRTDADLRAVAHQFIEESKLNNTTVDVGTNELGKFSKLTGSKMVDGAMATYETHFYWRKSSMLILTAATDSKNYPNARSKYFFMSVKSK